VPTVVVNLPPRVVEREKVVRHPGEYFDGCLIYGLAFCLYLAIVVFLGLVVPFLDVFGFAIKTQMRPGAQCTITSGQISSYTDDNGAHYDAYVYFTLRTPDGQEYDTTEYNTPVFGTSKDAQAYISSYLVNHIYPCWYHPAKPAVAMFSVNIGFGDYIGLFFSAVGFLLLGLLPNALIVRALWRAFWRRMRRA
jgi:hypothetical protein